MRSRAWAGDWTITQRFAEHPEVYGPRFGLWGGHNGVDFALPTGTPLYALEAGVAAEVADDPAGYGTTVYVAADSGRGWRYGHLEAVAVAVGTRVERGTLLGHSDNTGNSTGPHLHLGLRPPRPDYANGFGGYVDPLPTLATLEIEETPPMPDVTVTEEERQQLQGQIDTLNGVIRTLTDQRDYKDQLLGAANTRAGAAEEQVAQLRTQLAAAQAQAAAVPPPVTVTRAGLAVRVELSDGRAVEVPLAEGAPA